MVNRLRGLEGRFFWILAGAVVLVALALILGANIQRSSAESLPEARRTVLLTRGDIEEVVKAPGDVTARSAGLTFPVSGVVSDILVKPGQVVKAGQILAKLDTREAESILEAATAAQKVAQGKLDNLQNGPARELAAAQQNLKIAQTRFSQVKEGNATPEQLKAAQAGVDAAVSRYNVLVEPANSKDVAAAQAELNGARARLEKLKAGPSEAAKKEANARLDGAKSNLERVKTERANAVKQAENAVQKATQTRDAAKEAYDKAPKDLTNPDGSLKEGVKPEDVERLKALKLALDQANLALDGAQKNLEAARSQETSAVNEANSKVIEAEGALENLQSSAPQQDILNAEAAVSKAQAQYDRLSSPPTQDQVNAAQSEINQAKAILEGLNKGGSDKEIAVAQAEVDKYQQQVDELSKGVPDSDKAQAEGALEREKALVKQAQLRIEGANLNAPYNSVVESLNIAVGQSVAPGPTVVGLIDLSSLTFEAQVSQSNVQRIKAGQPVRVSFEGISGVRDTPFKGKVSFISFQPKAGAVVASAPVLVTPGASSGGPARTSVAAAAQVEPGYPVTIVLDRDPGMQTLKPGMSGRVRFVLDRKPNALVLPKIAVRSIETGPVVDVVMPDGNLITTPVTIGLMSDDYVEIVDSPLLREGDKIILQGDAPVPPLPTATPATSVVPTVAPGTVTPATPGSLAPGTPAIPTPATIGLIDSMSPAPSESPSADPTNSATPDALGTPVPGTPDGLTAGPSTSPSLETSGSPTAPGPVAPSPTATPIVTPAVSVSPTPDARLPGSNPTPTTLTGRGR